LIEDPKNADTFRGGRNRGKKRTFGGGGTAERRKTSSMDETRGRRGPAEERPTKETAFMLRGKRLILYGGRGKGKLGGGQSVRLWVSRIRLNLSK